VNLLKEVFSGENSAAQILGHSRPAAEQVGSQRLQPLPQPHHGGQGLGVAVQHGVLLLDVDQGLFVHVLQKLFGLLRYLVFRSIPVVDYACGDEETVVYMAAAAVIPPTVIAHLGFPTGKAYGSLASCTFETLSSESSLQRQSCENAEEAGGHRLTFVLPEFVPTHLILGFAPQGDLQVLL